MQTLLDQLDKSIASQRERIEDAKREIARLEGLRLKYGRDIALFSSCEVVLLKTGVGQ